MGVGKELSELLVQVQVKSCLYHCQPTVPHSFNVSLPLIPASETGPIRPITGKDVDVLLSDDRLPA